LRSTWLYTRIASIQNLSPFIVRYHNQRVCDRHGYTHVVLAFNTFRAAMYPDQKITDLSNLFIDIIYQIKTIELAKAQNNAIS
jgi:hypothetical protein